MVRSSSGSTSPIFSIKAINFEAGLESECSLPNTAHDEVFLEGSVGFFESVFREPGNMPLSDASKPRGGEVTPNIVEKKTPRKIESHRQTNLA